MRVLVLLTDAYGSLGGIAQYNRNLLRALCSYPEVSEVVAVPRLQPAATGPLPPKLTYAVDGLNSKLRYMETVWKVNRSNGKFSLAVIAHLNLLPLVKLLNSHKGAPIWLQLHGLEAWSPRNRFYRHCLNRVYTSVSVSQFTKGRFCEWSGFPSEKVAILPNSVDLSRFTPGPKNAELMRKYGLEGRTVLMSFGRLETTERAKGFDEVMQVLPDLLRQLPNLTYVICGDGSDQPRLEQKARALKIEKQVIFTGRVCECEKVDHYRLADAYVMPSRAEGFGIVFLEAMACGIPVVASKIDGSREAVRDPAWGVLVDPDNSPELMRGIMEALRRPRREQPEGLECFSDSSFEQRVHQLVRAMVEVRREHA